MPHTCIIYDPGQMQNYIQCSFASRYLDLDTEEKWESCSQSQTSVWNISHGWYSCSTHKAGLVGELRKCQRGTFKQINSTNDVFQRGVLTMPGF